jgi:phosphoribosylanthranilate isomerase
MNEQHNQPAATRVKICGITNLADARMAASAGTDFLGYILHPKSRRYISPPQVRAITDIIRIEFPQVQHVGVFVDAPEDGVTRTIEIAALNFAQLHGGESRQFCATLHSRGVSIIKVMKFGPERVGLTWTDYSSASYFLCDTFDERLAGGTGRAFDHTLLPADLPRKQMFLAGGLTPANVAAAVAQVHPFAVDVSSGVEEHVCKKNPARVHAFIAAAKQGLARLT